jgi:hypothetical protein
MEICAFCDGEGFIMNGMAFNDCPFCKGTGVFGGIKNFQLRSKKEDIHKKRVPKKQVMKIEKRNI